MARQSPPSECANCGSPIPKSARACPECGADERSGWRESSVYDGLDLPDHAWEDESSHAPASAEIAWYWWATGIGIGLILILTVLGLR